MRFPTCLPMPGPTFKGAIWTESCAALRTIASTGRLCIATQNYGRHCPPESTHDSSTLEIITPSPKMLRSNGLLQEPRPAFAQRSEYGFNLPTDIFDFVPRPEFDCNLPLNSPLPLPQQDTSVNPTPRLSRIRFHYSYNERRSTLVFHRMSLE